MRGAAARVLLAAVAAGVVAIATDPYPGVTIDSGEYLAVAEGVTEGYGYTMPYLSYDEPYRVLDLSERVTMTVFPPLYPSLLAAVSVAADVSVVTAARAVGIAVFFCVVLLSQALVRRDTRRWWSAALMGSLLLASDLVTVHAMAWSEAVMILAMLGALYFLRHHLETGRGADLALAGLCASAAALTRFAGIPIVFAGGAVLVTTGDAPRRRLAPATIFCVLSLAPAAGWFVRNGVVTGYASEKELGWHPPSVASLVQAAETLGSWVAPPGPAAGVLGFVFLIGGVTLLIRNAPNLRRKPTSSLRRLCLIFGSLYVAFVVAARTLLDQNIPFDTRMLAPVQVLVLLGVASSVRVGTTRAARAAVVGVVLVAAVSVGRGVQTAVTFSNLSVAGYTGEQWLRSETLDFVGRVPRDVVVITNTPDPVWLWHDRASLFIPPRSNLYSGQPNENYSAQLDEVRATTECRRAIVAFFNRPNRKPPRDIDPLIVYELGLTKTNEFEDGEIYDVDEPVCHAEGEPAA